MEDEVADLRSYYEEEARQDLRGPLRGRRVDLRSEYVQLLLTEGRRTVIDFGAGPGRDAEGFSNAGIAYTGLDLAHGNGVLAAGRGVTVVQGSIAAPPLRAASFDAGWSMSTLMHVTETDVPAVLGAMVRPLASGAPLLIAQWGGQRGEYVDDMRLPGERRLFSLRTFDHNRELLAAAGSIEREERWEARDEEYHVFLIRT